MSGIVFKGEGKIGLVEVAFLQLAVKVSCERAGDGGNNAGPRAKLPVLGCHRAASIPSLAPDTVPPTRNPQSWVQVQVWEKEIPVFLERQIY